MSKMEVKIQAPTAELLEKVVRVKLIKRGYREGCGEVEDSIVKLSATLP
jgi:hypothetical protein